MSLPVHPEVDGKKYQKKNCRIVPAAPSVDNNSFKYQRFFGDFTNYFEDWTLDGAAKFGIVENGEKNQQSFRNKLFLDIITSQQMIEHNDRSKLFYWVIINGLDEIREMLGINPGLIKERDAFGGTPIHCAFSCKQFETAHWLIENYPHVTYKNILFKSY